MGLASMASGAQTAVINTEHSVTTQTAVGAYVFVVETTNMASSDVLHVKLKTVSKSGATAQYCYDITYTDAQTVPNKYSDVIPVDQSITAIIQQTAGTGRVFNWNLLRA